MSNFTFPTPKTIQEAAFQARIADRAEVLFSAGYEYEFVTACSAGGYYRVSNPDGAEYIVDPLIGTCSCKCFEENRVCKHALAIDQMEQQVAQLEADEESKYH